MILNNLQERNGLSSSAICGRFRSVARFLNDAREAAILMEKVTVTEHYNIVLFITNDVRKMSSLNGHIRLLREYLNKSSSICIVPHLCGTMR